MAAEAEAAGGGLVRGGGRRADHNSVSLALLQSMANREPLNPNQQILVREMATSGRRLQLAIAPADGSAQVAAGMRICLGFDEISYAMWNENAYELLAAAVNYGLGITELARNPRPSDGAKNVGPAALQWSAGQGAASHNVYFGTNPTPGAAELVSERQTDTTYVLPADLVPQTTYYWRIPT